MIDEEQVHNFTESFNKLGSAMAQAFSGWWTKAEPVFIETMAKIDAAAWQAYRDAGAIYGDTEEGRARWLREYAEIQQLRAMADDLEWRQESLRLFREQLAEHRRNHT